MLKPLFAAALVTLAACGPGASAQTAEGALTVNWTIEESGKSPVEGKVQFAISRRTATSNWINTNTTALADLRGLTPEQLASESGAPVRFRVDRDSGSLDCEGIVRRRRGTGECSFAPDPRFAAALQQRGIGAANPMQLFSMAMGRVGLNYVEELERQRYTRPAVEDLVKAANHGAGLDYLRSMGELGYRAGTVAALVRMRDHGVSPAYVRELTSLGIRDVPAADLVRLRDHGVSARFVGDLQQLGYSGLSANEIVRLRSHGVTSDFIRRANAGGRRSVDELVRMRISG